MRSNNYRTNVLVRIAILTLTIFLFANQAYNYSFSVTQLIIVFLLGVQLVSLFKYLDRIHKETLNFLESIQYDEYDTTYPDEAGSSFDFLYKEFNKVIRKMREIRAEKNEHYYYLRNIVRHLGIGLITFNKGGDVQILNTTARKLLNVKNLKNVKDLQSLSPVLVETFSTLKTGGSDLIKIERNGEIVQLSLYAIELTLKGEVFKLISLQNIQSELEEKEMEAWQNLIRVLTHEIMNSVTPISSLAASVDQELVTHIQEGAEKSIIETEDMADIHMAVQTIQKRSEGLIRFVSDFRNLTRIPTPKIEEVLVADLFNRIKVLLKHDLAAGQIDLNIFLEEEGLMIKADHELVEQVIINLMKNAIQALEEKEKDRAIELSAYWEQKKRVIIKVKDNGPGIEEEAISKIFIPFFTTKKQGSGIGLSISKQIMRQHKGNISVKSTIDEGTEFVLKF